MMKAYWKKGISFEQYVAAIEKKTSLSQIIPEEKIKKYKQSLQKIENILENYVPDIQQENLLKNKNFNGKILIIAEDWCSDCRETIPVIKKFFDQKNQVKILYRDENPELMKLFLTNGSESVPIVIFLDNNDNILNCWGPRTKHGKELLLRYKRKNEAFSREEFISELHMYYNKNKGFDVIKEIVEAL